MLERRDSTDEGKDPLLSLAAHEFRNATSPAQGYIRMLLKGSVGALTERQEQLLALAQKSLGNIADLSNQLSQWSLLEGGGIKLKLLPVDFGPLVAAAIDALPGHEVPIRVTLRNLADGVIVQGDADLLRQAVGTLLVAVRRHLVNVDELVVALRRTGPGPDGNPQLRLTLAGSDLAQDVEARTPAELAPFHEYQEGLGFRPAIARRIVQVHGGQLWSLPLETREFSTRPYWPPSAVMIVPGD